jgi:hypothetical protein
MTLITFQDGKVVMRDGKVGTEQACCCGGEEVQCDEVGHCVHVVWDLEYLDFFTACDPRVFNAASGSASFYFDPNDQSLSKLVCLNGVAVADDTPYKVSDGLWDIPSGASFPLRISGTISPPPDCFEVQVLLTSEFSVGLSWPGSSYGGQYVELTEDQTANPPCGAEEVTVRGSITVTDTWPVDEGDCGCP